jgi:hypothetical protein
MPPKPRKPKLSNRRQEKRFMTVCVSALASNEEAIVCIADKALSYGDHFQWDSDSIKMLPVNPSGSLIMFAGGERGTSKVLARILARESEVGTTTVADTTKLLEAEYKAAKDELVEQLYLAPRLLKRSDYLDAVKGAAINPYIKSVAEEIDAFDMDCQLLVCGFDGEDKPFILDVMNPGVVTDMTTTGFHAIGSGWGEAVSHLLFTEHKRTHGVDRVLYDVFDAKANAELNANVGYEWDAQVIVAGINKPVFIPRETQKLIERVWVKATRSPFEKRTKEDAAPPPSNWRDELSTFAVAVMKPVMAVRSKRLASRKSKATK